MLLLVVNHYMRTVDYCSKYCVLHTFKHAYMHTYIQTGAEYKHEYEEKLDIPPLYYPTNEYAQQCYDATWTLAYALNKTLNGMVC